MKKDLCAAARLQKDGKSGDRLDVPKQIAIGTCGLVDELGFDLPLSTEREIVKRYNVHARLVELANFLRSVIKSGEPWSATCEREFNEAMKSL